MAAVDTLFQASSYQALVTAVNAFLATLTNPKILKWYVRADNILPRVGTEWKALLTTDTGGAALATPFLLNILQENNNPALMTSLANYRSTYAGQFLSGVLYDVLADDSVVSSKVWAAFIRNTTAGATANYLIQS